MNLSKDKESKKNWKIKKQGTNLSGIHCGLITSKDSFT